ncbi:MAG: SDR family oxidoreductase [Brevundimonas sp.]|uniref:SDR family NAD(P)-dependent oxidoreductase n=1 Tax=Brevundimonas sp. TaxID=1871086 RepID=UPI0025C6C80C|nr:SDR family NAD(P)-dependent oxidoreductase [Brevundimonas sp.]MCH4268606.1 SDR family oxidoreductase [Brevundimonas sp.]
MTDFRSADASSRGVALVTAASRRIGAVLAKAAAQAGYDVVIHYRSDADGAQGVVQAIEAMGRRAVAVQAELTDAAGRTALIDQAAAFGPLRALVNNASLFVYDQLETFHEADLRLHHEVNVLAPLALIRDFAARLPDGDEGVVVNMLDYKVTAPNPDFFSYTVSRVGIAHMTGALALALAPRIRVCGIAPGLTLPSAGWPEADYEAGAEATPLKRPVAVEDLAAALTFILTTRSLTGQNLVVDAGAGLTPRDRDLEFA